MNSVFIYLFFVVIENNGPQIKKVQLVYATRYLNRQRDKSELYRLVCGSDKLGEEWER